MMWWRLGDGGGDAKAGDEVWGGSGGGSVLISLGFLPWREATLGVSVAFVVEF